MTWLAAIVAWFCLISAAFAVVQALMNRFLMRATYGPYRYDEQSSATWLIGLRSGRILQLGINKWVLFAVGAAFLAHRLQHVERPWENLGDLWLPMLALMTGCVQFYGQSRPAGVLVLGASTVEAMELQQALAKRLFPHRPVSLLEGSGKFESVRILPGDVFRITWGDWQDAVWRFARTVQVIVVDVRQMTPPVDRELQFLIEEDLTFKTVLLLPPGAELPYPALAACRIVRSPDECVALLARAFAGYATLPSDVKPIRELDLVTKA